MPVAARLLIAIAPLLLSLVFAYLLTGALSLGGGEKDILLAIPLLAWSFLFLVCFSVAWARRRSILRSVAMSSVVATGVLVALLVALFVVLG